MNRKTILKGLNINNPVRSAGITEYKVRNPARGSITTSAGNEFPERQNIKLKCAGSKIKSHYARIIRDVSDKQKILAGYRIILNFLLNNFPENH